MGATREEEASSRGHLLPWWQRSSADTRFSDMPTPPPMRRPWRSMTRSWPPKESTRRPTARSSTPFSVAVLATGTWRGRSERFGGSCSRTRRQNRTSRRSTSSCWRRRGVIAHRPPLSSFDSSRRVTESGSFGASPETDCLRTPGQGRCESISSEHQKTGEGGTDVWCVGFPKPSQLRPSRVSFEAYARACAKIGAVDAAVDTLEKAKAPQDFQEALHSSDGVELHRLLDDAAILEKQEAEDEGDLPQRKEDAKPPKQREKAAAGPLVPPTASHRQFETSHVRPILHQESKVSEQLAMMLVDQEARKSRTEPLWPLSVFYDYTAKLLSEKPSTPPEAVQSPPPSAKELIHAYRAPDGSYEVDLHGCTALEARARVRLALDEIERVQEGELRIITGKGNSSAGSPASLQAAVLDLFADLKLICRNESGNIGRLVIPLDELRAFWKRSQTDRMTLGMRNMLALQLLLVLSGGLATVVIQSIT
mmetsp:Transcript_11388/g.42515  ORF Transcript_11388/g.42515 Transcript_11388/m.42515 type:complete len:480 (+) Transcript_11388:475-1914(+)